MCMGRLKEFPGIGFSHELYKLGYMVTDASEYCTSTWVPQQDAKVFVDVINYPFKEFYSLMLTNDIQANKVFKIFSTE